MKLPKNLSLIRRMRDARLRQLPGVEPLVAASLVQAGVRCGKSTCRCASGEKHTAYYLTFKVKATTRTVYVPKDHVEEVRQWVEEHRRVRTLLSEISQLSLGLLSAQARIRRERQSRQAD